MTLCLVVTVMDSIFAPWRMQWVQRDHTEDNDDVKCTFCELPEKGDDRENRIIARSDHVYVLLNNMPYNPGHSMVIPYNHANKYQHLNESILMDCMKTAQQIIAALDRSLSPSGFNIGLKLGSAGGASIPDHLHTHIIPRWKSDTSFMPLTANTAVVEEAVDETYTRLREALAENEMISAKSESEAIYLSY